MSTITADPNMKSILSQVTGVTEIRDANGNLMGIYTPKGKTDEEIKKLFDLEKARAKLATEKTRPFREMIDNLEKRAEKQG
jgi:hypothetical protein